MLFFHQISVDDITAEDRNGYLVAEKEDEVTSHVSVDQPEDKHQLIQKLQEDIEIIRKDYEMSKGNNTSVITLNIRLYGLSMSFHLAEYDGPGWRSPPRCFPLSRWVRLSEINLEGRRLLIGFFSIALLLCGRGAFGASWALGSWPPL